MSSPTQLSDLIGIEHSKLGYFQELRQKIEELQVANKESENRRREIAAILDGITDVMMVLSEDMRIISVNGVFRALFDDPLPEGKFCYQIFRGADHPCAECPAFKSLSTNTVCKETAIFRIGGVNRQFEMVASPLKNPHLPEHRVLIFKRDVTLEKEYQAKYYHAEKMATVGVLATGVAHELNNPLMGISGYAEGLQRSIMRHSENLPLELSQDLREYSDIILKECQRCQGIVHSLLNFGHPISSVFSPISINDVVKETLQLLHYHLKKHNLVLKVSYDNILPHISGDAPQLKQVLLNLLTNAIDALEGRHGTISVKTYASGGAACMEVADTGRGVSESVRDNMFDPFFTTKPVGKGIGVGLSTCYNIVKEHRGEIFVESEEGAGSRFVVSLPAPQGEDNE
ncbi:MAG: two-component system, NtrC family, sensor kinase [Desulfovibrionales bacterium]|nr:two-component system, NtrC family, sensor kinase [Desulfovibrionales bacterium]